MRCRDIAMALIGTEVQAFRANRVTPPQRVAGVAVVSEPNRPLNVRHQTRDHLAVAAETIASEDKAAASDALGAIGALDLNACDPTAILKQRRGTAVADNINAFRLACRAQAVDQFATRACRQSVHATA